MTLKEKFNELVPKEFGGMQEPLLSDCEKIADDYAIDFAEWVVSRASGEDGLKLKDDVLEIFKKEKGL